MDTVNHNNQILRRKSELTIVFVCYINKNEVLMQNFLLTNVKDRLTYNIVFIKFCSKIRKRGHQK